MELIDGLPFDAHGRQSQYRTNSRDILHVVDKFTQKHTKGPSVGKELGHLEIQIEKKKVDID